LLQKLAEAIPAEREVSSDDVPHTRVIHFFILINPFDSIIAIEEIFVYLLKIDVVCFTLSR